MTFKTFYLSASLDKDTQHLQCCTFEQPSTEAGQSNLFSHIMQHHFFSAISRCKCVQPFNRPGKRSGMPNCLLALRTFALQRRKKSKTTTTSTHTKHLEPHDTYRLSVVLVLKLSMLWHRIGGCLMWRFEACFLACVCFFFVCPWRKVWMGNTIQETIKRGNSRKTHG